MKTIFCYRVGGALRLGALALLSLCIQPAGAQDAHHHGHADVPAMDADGRRLDPDAKHELSDEQLAALREKIAPLQGTDGH